VKETKQTVHVADRKLRYEKKGQTEPKGFFDLRILITPKWYLQALLDFR
jgi:hypothetical protein